MSIATVSQDVLGDDISPFVSVSNEDTPDRIQSPATLSSLNLLSGDIHRETKGFSPKPLYALRFQSNHFCENKNGFTASDINNQVKHDLIHRVTQVREGLLVEQMFPDDVFGFSIYDLFVENFYNSVVSGCGEFGGG